MLPYQRNMSFLCQVQPWSWSVAIQALVVGDVPLPCLITRGQGQQATV